MGKKVPAALSSESEVEIKCLICNKVNTVGRELCQYCKPKLNRICGPEADAFNQQLAAVIRNTKANCRRALVNKLVSTVNTEEDPK